MFKGVSEVDMINYFKKLSGVDKLPPPRSIKIKGEEYKLYVIKDKKRGLTFNLRDGSKSSEQTGAKWTIDIVGVKGKEFGGKTIRQNSIEVKFK